MKIQIKGKEVIFHTIKKKYKNMANFADAYGLNYPDVYNILNTPKRHQKIIEAFAKELGTTPDKIKEIIKNDEG